MAITQCFGSPFSNHKTLERSGKLEDFRKDVQKDQVQQQRQQLIKEYQFSPGLRDKFSKKRPELDSHHIDLVFTALKDYFHLCLNRKNKMVSITN